MARAARRFIATEHEEQSAVVEWCDWQVATAPELANLFAIPNGAYKSRTAASRFKREGLRSGVPDLFLAVARNGRHGLFIEMKRRERGRLSPSQIEWRERLQAAGYVAEVCYGATEAIQVIKLYLGMG